jgi:hypothetical protein
MPEERNLARGRAHSVHEFASELTFGGTLATSVGEPKQIDFDFTS